jgi:hypothetical protein
MRNMARWPHSLPIIASTQAAKTIYVWPSVTKKLGPPAPDAVFDETETFSTPAEAQGPDGDVQVVSAIVYSAVDH